MSGKGRVKGKCSGGGNREANRMTYLWVRCELEKRYSPIKISDSDIARIFETNPANIVIWKKRGVGMPMTADRIVTLAGITGMSIGDVTLKIADIVRYRSGIGG